jgi:hypothetical protein
MKIYFATQLFSEAERNWIRSTILKIDSLAHERGIEIGVRTDFRNAGESSGQVVNAMIECSCDRIAQLTGELLGIPSESVLER